MAPKLDLYVNDIDVFLFVYSWCCISTSDNLPTIVMFIFSICANTNNYRLVVSKLFSLKAKLRLPPNPNDQNSYPHIKENSRARVCSGKVLLRDCLPSLDMKDLSTFEYFRIN